MGRDPRGLGVRGLGFWGAPRTILGFVGEGLDFMGFGIPLKGVRVQGNPRDPNSPM